MGGLSENSIISTPENGWITVRLKHLLLEPAVYGANESAEQAIESHPRYIRITDMSSDGMLKPDTFRSLPPKMAKNYLLKDGDILLARSGATVGKSFYYRQEFGICCFAGYLIRYRANRSKILPEYVFWFLQTSFFWEFISESQIQATIQNVSAEKYGELPISLPDIIEEQKSICRYLDYEVSKIDTLIKKQQKLIELLKEKRQAVISHAVTKGLNPNAPMKDSGVEWLGEVPEHWESTRIKHITESFEQGWSPQCDARPATTDEYGVMKVGCVNFGVFRPTENKALPENLTPKKEYTLVAGDVLISRANTKELVGSAAVVDDDYPNLLLCDKLYRLRFSRGINPEIVALFLSIYSIREQIELGASGASHSMQNISQDIIKELSIVIPPPKEADELLCKLKSKLQTFLQLEQKAVDAIQLLKERRTALISAAVTGKIDVRNWRQPTSTFRKLHNGY